MHLTSIPVMDSISRVCFNILDKGVAFFYCSCISSLWCSIFCLMQEDKSLARILVNSLFEISSLHRSRGKTIACTSRPSQPTKPAPPRQSLGPFLWIFSSMFVDGIVCRTGAEYSRYGTTRLSYSHVFCYYFLSFSSIVNKPQCLCSL